MENVLVRGAVSPKPGSTRIDFAQLVIVLFVGIFALMCMLPFVLLIVISFTDDAAIIENGYSFFPEMLSLSAYRTLFSNPALATGYRISTLLLLAGTSGAVLITAMAAFALSNKSVACRDGLSLFFYFTMVFSVGIVPWYLMCRTLGLYDNIWALLIPRLIFSPFNLFLVRNYMNAMPGSLVESARIEGANDVTIAFRIYFPLSLPVLASIALFYGIGYWNDWYNAAMLVNNSALYPLQFMLLKLKGEIAMLREMQIMLEGDRGLKLKPPAESLKMATTVLTVGPIILFYPLLQRFFVKGLIIGAVKG